MCGIAGFMGEGDSDLIGQMLKVLEHRGPDSQGSYIGDRIGLGNRRLSILDKENGDQPIHNEDQTVWVTYNGEIYNYKAIREGLKENGHRFYTDTDTEVIVHAYEEWGINCVERFNGMFAFAVWDSEKEEIFLARDHLGKKPLYFFSGDKNLYFGSEIKSVLEAKKVPRRLDKDRLREYLALGYVNSPYTLFREIKKLPPGHTLTFDGEKLRIHGYYSYREKPALDKKDSGSLDSLLRKSVRDRIFGNERPGVFLSGGIDSTAVTGYLSSFMDKPIKTYTVGFGSEKFDEFEKAEEIADYYGTDHTSFMMDPGDLELLPEIVYYFDDLVADQAIFPTYLLSEKTRGHKMVLTGSGGDEVFGGYEHYRIMRYGNMFVKPLPGKLRRVLFNMIKTIPDKFLDLYFPYASDLGEKGMERFGKYLQEVDDPVQAYLAVNAVMNEDEMEKLLGNEEYRLPDILGEYLRGRNIVSEVMELEMNVHLPEKILAKADRSGMANGIEIRTPLLSREIVRFGSELPSDKKVTGRRDKLLFRKAVNEVVPEKVASRSKQRLFMPIHDWLGDDMRWFVEEVLDESYSSETCLDRSYIERLLERYDSSPLYYSRQLWHILNFETWYDTFIAGDEIRKVKF